MINLFDFWSIPVPDKCTTCGACVKSVSADLRSGEARVRYECERQTNFANSARGEPGTATDSTPCKQPRVDLAKRLVAMVQVSELPQSDKDDAVNSIRCALGVWGGATR